MTRSRHSTVVIGLVSAAAWIALAAAPAVASPAQRLADRYAPIAVLKAQDAPCDSRGEAWRPVAVDALLGNASVRLIGPAGAMRAPKESMVPATPVRTSLVKGPTTYAIA